MTETLSSKHRETYNNLALEYEKRAAASIEVTSKAIDFFTPYLRPSGAVIDVGCGVGTSIYLLSRRGFRVTGIDLSPKMVDFARKRNPTSIIKVADFMTFECDYLFDGAIAFAFIHLFPRTTAALVCSRIASLLKPQGVAIVSTTESFVDREGWEMKSDYNTSEYRFRSYWTKKRLTAQLVESGFRTLAVERFRDPFGKIWLDFIIKRRN